MNNAQLTQEIVQLSELLFRLTRKSNPTYSEIPSLVIRDNAVLSIGVGAYLGVNLIFPHGIAGLAALASLCAFCLAINAHGIRLARRIHKSREAVRQQMQILADLNRERAKLLDDCGQELPQTTKERTDE